jgi:hypothetical protein
MLSHWTATSKIFATSKITRYSLIHTMSVDLHVTQVATNFLTTTPYTVPLEFCSYYCKFGTKHKLGTSA